VDHWLQFAQVANAYPLLSTAEQQDREQRNQADQQDIKRLQQELRRKHTTLADVASLL
jgi:hypothetical protein